MSAVALSIRHSPAQPGPTRLRVADLLQTTDRIADAVLCGQYDRLLPVGGLPADERWFARLYGDDELDVWLISWVPGRATKLHDHAGSLGAVTLLSGALSEYRWDGSQLRYRRLEAGDQAGFPLGWVHDVVWAQPSAEVGGPTLSVHAYSPPLTAMSYYSVTGSGRLRRERTELTEDPEGE
jgi:Cysteine dioxygenase type I